VDSFEGLLVEYVQKRNANFSRSWLARNDRFRVRLQMALMNRKLDETMETIFLMPNEKYTYLKFKFCSGNCPAWRRRKQFVPPVVLKRLDRKIKSRIFNRLSSPFLL